MGGRNQNTGRGSGGRNAGRGNANGGRGNGSFGNKNRNGSNTKKEKKFHPLTRGKTPDFSFVEVKKELITNLSNVKMDHINDVIISVSELKLIDLKKAEPKLRIITDVKDSEREEKNKQF